MGTSELLLFFVPVQHFVRKDRLAGGGQADKVRAFGRDGRGF